MWILTTITRTAFLALALARTVESCAAMTPRLWALSIAPLLAASSAYAQAPGAVSSDSYDAPWARLSLLGDAVARSLVYRHPRLVCTSRAAF